MKKRWILCVLSLFLLGLISCTGRGNRPEPGTTAGGTGDGTATSEEDTDARIVTQLRVVYGSGATETEKNAAKTLRAALKDALGEAPELTNDSRGREAGVYEILVGNTNRAESNAARDAVRGTRYLVELGEDYAVLYASNVTCLDAAVEHFLAVGVTEAGVRSFSEARRTVSDPLPALSLVRGGSLQYEILYSRMLTSAAMSGAVRSLVTTVNETAGVNAGAESAGGTLPEGRVILIGSVGDSAAAQRFYDSLKPNEYGIVSDGSRICLLGKTDHTLRLCMEQFSRLFRNSLELGEDGNWDVSLVYGEPLCYTYDAYAVDYPLYPGKDLTWLDCADDTLLCLADNADADAYEAYLETLSGAGYAPVQSRTVGKNRFATLADADTVLVVNYLDADSSVRVFSSARGDTALPTENPVDAAVRVTESRLSVLALNYAVQNVKVGNNGLAFVFTLEDGSYLIYDGGNEADADALYAYLEANNRRTDGKIVIAAWVLTHSHSDHYGCFHRFASDYGKRVSLESLITSPVSMYRWKGEADDSYLSENLESDVRRFSGTRRIVTPHMGQCYAVGNAAVEILMTSEDVFPYRLEYGNEGCMVTRVTLEGCSVLMMGDCENTPSAKLISFYGDALKSDVLQVPHHGNSGGSEKLYRLVDPHTAIFPTSAVSFEKYTAPGWRDGSNYLLVQEIAAVARHAGETWSLPLGVLAGREEDV